ncbi:hypothetical protein [Massilibacteroides vaginae]|uniref:hypothetical protein n=1 Tax=Massilibacteroides vaginae TaxID=1673718 RepID=UPI000A1CCD7C|nr:hypothetical protein [Massilibacteroides vaginae]
MGNFAEGLYAMSRKGFIGPRVHLTRRRAWILRDIIKEAECYVPDEDHPRYNDYCATLEWMRQEIKKRYSEFDLGKL